MGRQLERVEIDAACRAAHEANRTWNDLIGTFVEKPWEMLREEEKQPARNSTIGIVTHDFNAQQTHEAWVAEKKSQGWTYGPVKNLSTKEHPALVSWDQLSDDNKVKDEMWVDNVKNFVRHLWRVPQG